MGQIAQGGRAARGVISVDWMLLTVAVFALGLLVATMIRTPTEPDAYDGSGGLTVLSEDDVLLAFQDFSFGADGWSISATEDQLGGLGPVLGRFMDETVERSFEVPEGATRVEIRFDLHLAGNWTSEGAVEIFIDEASVLGVPWPDEDGGALVPASSAENVEIAVRQFTITPRQDVDSATGVVGGLASYSIALIVEGARSEVTLRLAPAMDPATVGASWAIDNVVAIARATEDPDAAR